MIDMRNPKIYEVNFMTKKIVFSGIQPSGKLMIGNYIGAIKSWLNLQHEYECLFTLVDLHTITVKQDPKTLREQCYDFAAWYIALGIDPKQSTIFVQSHVAQHAELAWILNCYTYLGELNRMTQFKDKSQKHAQNINIGLMDYPVLMAADILLYQTDLVPVGEDQKQHLELTRDLAQRFNYIYGDVFKIPEVFIPPVGARIMSLANPLQKMSKSDANESSYIALNDDSETIIKKLKRAVTDSGSEVYFDAERPGISNLMVLFSAVSNLTIQQIEEHYRHAGYGKFKLAVADAIVEFLRPLQMEYKKLREDLSYLEKILKAGAVKATERAEKTMKTVAEVIGLVPR